MYSSTRPTGHIVCILIWPSPWLRLVGNWSVMLDSMCSSIWPSQNFMSQHLMPVNSSILRKPAKASELIIGNQSAVCQGDMNNCRWCYLFQHLNSYRLFHYCWFGQASSQTCFCCLDDGGVGDWWDAGGCMHGFLHCRDRFKSVPLVLQV